MMPKESQDMKNTMRMSWGCGLEVGPHLDQRRPLEQHCIVCVEGVHLVQPAVGHVQFAVLAHQAHHGRAGYQCPAPQNA